ncbi:hypothetical protein ABVK25_006777 [Lepraria finkii]|uniref:Uncharacterized protein n=1 Tax=Lepraria finkii TaxID=1340010 RepID=A0ABR4BAH4_9LECA
MSHPSRSGHREPTFHACEGSGVCLQTVPTGQCTGGKVGGRYTKKKAAGRVAKRSGTTSTAKLDALVARQVQKVLSSGALKERRKITLELSLSQTQVFINSKASLCNSIRIPITDALPSQQGAAYSPDVRRRSSNKIVVTGVNVRASFSVSDENRVMLMPYEPHESVRRHLETVSVLMEPDVKQGAVPEAFATHMVPFQHLGLVSEHGPLMTKKSGNGVVLDSVDGSPFESRVSTHAGKPMGAVVRKKFGGGGLRRTVNWNQDGDAEVGMGFTAWTTHTLNEYWKLGKEYKYMFELSNRPVFERSVEMFLYVDCPSLESKEISEENALVGAVVRNVIVDIYFHDG